jgi:hypothetical protein
VGVAPEEQQGEGWQEYRRYVIAELKHGRERSDEILSTLRDLREFQTQTRDQLTDHIKDESVEFERLRSAVASNKNTIRKWASVIAAGSSLVASALLHYFTPK